MSDAALGILKVCLLVLLYLFLLRVVLLVASELRGTPGLGRVAAPGTGAMARGVDQAGAPPLAPAVPPSRRDRKHAQPDQGAKGWRLVVAEPAAARGTEFRVVGELTIGRGGGCGIALPSDTYVSTVHARAFDHDGALWIEDLGSTNGTLVNDQPLTEPARLRRGDRVTIGGTVLEATR